MVVEPSVMAGHAEAACSGTPSQVVRWRGRPEYLGQLSSSRVGQMLRVSVSDLKPSTAVCVSCKVYWWANISQVAALGCAVRILAVHFYACRGIEYIHRPCFVLASAIIPVAKLA